MENYEKSEVALEKNISEIRCLLILSFCPQYGETIAAGGIASLALTTTTCFTDVIAGSIDLGR